MLDEIDKRNIPYVIVEPDNLVWNVMESPERQKERRLIKQQWFGRFVLRDNSHIEDFDRWLTHIKDIYDDRTGHEFLKRHKQKAFFLLKQDQYLSDIIDDLYWKKEHNAQLCCANKE